MKSQKLTPLATAPRPVTPPASVAVAVGEAPADRQGTLHSEARKMATYQIPLTDIEPDPSNPRTMGGLLEVAGPEIDALAEDIRVNGLLQAITVRKMPDDHGAKYRIIAGESRFAAARQAGLAKIHAVVRDDLTDAQLRALQWSENELRTNFSPLQRAQALDQLRRESQEAIDAGRELTWLEIAQSPYAARESEFAVRTVFPRLLDLPRTTQALIANRYGIGWSTLYRKVLKNRTDLRSDDVHKAVVALCAAEDAALARAEQQLGKAATPEQIAAAGVRLAKTGATTGDGTKLRPVSVFDAATPAGIDEPACTVEIRMLAPSTRPRQKRALQEHASNRTKALQTAFRLIGQELAVITKDVRYLTTIAPTPDGPAPEDGAL